VDARALAPRRTARSRSQIYTRNIPYDGMQPVQVVALVLNRRERPRVPADCPPPLAQLMQACWQHDPANRPSFEDIVRRLSRLPP
jgi:Protein tyrosine and serine/threonine kinase